MFLLPGVCGIIRYALTKLIPVIDYTTFSQNYQIKLPLNLKLSVPASNPVRLLTCNGEEH